MPNFKRSVFFITHDVFITRTTRKHNYVARAMKWGGKAATVSWVTQSVLNLFSFLMSMSQQNLEKG